MSKGASIAAQAISSRDAIVSRGNGSHYGTIIAEGDSWLEYPGGNLRSELEALGWEVFSVASNGDRLEAMVYDEGQQEKLARAFQKCAKREEDVRAVLLSGGGNDVIGDVLPLILNHAQSGLERVNLQIRDGQFARLAEALRDLCDAVRAYSKRYLGREVPILVHGYDVPYPTGRGFLSGFGPLPGPWLKPAFERRGYDADGENRLYKNREVLDTLVYGWNRLLEQLAMGGLFRYVSLRGTLERTEWKDELHPNRDGFAKLAQKIDGVLQEVRP